MKKQYVEYKNDNLRTHKQNNIFRINIEFTKISNLLRKINNLLTKINNLLAKINNFDAKFTNNNHFC